MTESEFNFETEPEIYTETDCIIEIEGYQLESGGTIVTPDLIIGYLAENCILTDWHGRKIGEYEIVSTWKIAHGYITNHMNQVEARVNSIIYTGRSGGIGLVYKGKRKKRKQ